jgi:hypothetical protein
MDNIIQGRLLGYGSSKKNFILVNDASRNICRATHATLDNAQLSTHKDELTTKSLALWGALNCSSGTVTPSTAEMLTPPTDFCILATKYPLLNIDTIHIDIATDPAYRPNIIV